MTILNLTIANIIGTLAAMFIVIPIIKIFIKDEIERQLTVYRKGE